MYAELSLSWAWIILEVRSCFRFFKLLCPPSKTYRTFFTPIKFHSYSITIRNTLFYSSLRFWCDCQSISCFHLKHWLTLKLFLGFQEIVVQLKEQLSETYVARGSWTHHKNHKETSYSWNAFQELHARLDEDYPLEGIDCGKVKILIEQASDKNKQDLGPELLLKYYVKADQTTP